MAPSWQDIADTLRSRIAAGTYPVDSFLPSTARLCGEFGVSTTPVRRAVDLLTRDGLVRGELGRGVRVVAAPPTPVGRSIEDRVAELEQWRDQHERGHDRENN